MKKSLEQKLHLQKSYNGSPTISKEKKQDLLNLLPKIGTIFHQSYMDLKKSESLKNIDPDIVESEEEHNNDDRNINNTMKDYTFCL